MRKSAPPFLYDPPPKYGVNSPAATFNPKAVTQASWAPRPTKQKKNGPLIDFNRHPDSYGVIPPGMQHAGNISPNIKRNVKIARITQLILRINTLIAALGVLFCVIAIKNTTVHLAWIIRVGPGVSLLHTLYAIYHLSRSAVSRPPGSTTSYMLFASILDAGLIPFFVLTSIISKSEFETRSYKWETLFEEEDITSAIFFATFLATAVAGGLHSISLVIDIYLAVVFRKITKLPPDMNPLEDNLTSRRHKRTKSEIAEKHLSTSTFNSVPYPDSPVRSVPFMHTRNDSDVSTVSQSQIGREDRASYHSAQSNRFSRSDLPSQQFRQFEQTSTPKTPITRAAAKRRGTGPSRPQSAVFHTPPTSMHSRPGSSTGQTRELSGVSALSDDNWEVYPSNPGSPELRAREVSPLRSRSASPDITDEQFKRMEYGNPYEDSALHRGSGTVRRYRGVYTAVEDEEDDDQYIPTYADNQLQVESDLGDRYYAGARQKENIDTGSHLPINPLEMNPPTPRPLEIERTVLSDIPNPSVHSGHSTPIGTPNGKKQRSYGELIQNTPSPSRHYEDSTEKESSALFKKSKPSTPSSRWRRWSGKPSVYETLQAENGDSDHEETNHKSGETDRKGRVVSNTGADINLDLGGSGSPGYGNYLAGIGVGRRRDVSGKVAEEGRGGDLVREDNTTPSKKGRRLSKTGEHKAAGWARWKGL